MQVETFEDFLKCKHAEDYMGTDDDMGERFEEYLDDMGKEEMLTLADLWKNKIIELAQLKVKQIKGVYSAHQALEEVDRILASLIN